MRSSSGNVPDPHWVNPAAILYKITPVRDLRGSKGGNWDLDRRHVFQDCLKYRAVRDRYVAGKDWLETDLFADAYRRRLERDGRIGRATTLEALAEDYTRRFDKLHAVLTRDGFRTENGNGKKLSLPAFLIGRDGEVFIGNQGNHRLALAQVLGLDRIAGRIACRHELASPPSRP